MHIFIYIWSRLSLVISLVAESEGNGRRGKNIEELPLWAPGPLWASLASYWPGPYVHPWVLMGRALMDLPARESLGPHGWGPYWASLGAYGLGGSSPAFHTLRFNDIYRSKYAGLVRSVEVRWVGAWEVAWLPDFHTQHIKT